MQISATVTIRRGRTFEIKGTSADGTQLLRPTVTYSNVDEVLGEMFSQARSQLDARVPAPVKALERKTPMPAKTEPATIKYARREEVSASTRVGSQWGYGLRSHASVKHGFKTKREVKALTESQKGRNRAKRLGNEGGWVGKTASWKDTRDTQYR